MISALAPAALALTKRFMVELPVHAALQWLTARVGHARFGPFVTEPLGAWSNLALFFAEPQDGAPARQKPLAAHTDRLNAQFCKPRWIEGARAQELSAALEVRRGEVEHRGPTALVRGPDGIASRCSELASLRLQLATSANRGPWGGREQAEEEEEEEEEEVHETTAAFNLVTEGSLVGGYLVLLVGTLNGDPLPKGDAARYKLIIERRALLTFVPLNYEVLFSAGVLTHMGTPLSGSGLNARAILYLTGALERSVGHFEAAAAVADNAAGVREPPLLMNASDKRKVIDETQALEDTSRPDDLTLEQLEAAVAEFNSGELRGCPGNLEAAFALGVDALAELGALAGDEACEQHVALKREKRSTVNGECYGPMPFPAMETRYQLLSPRVRARADELERSGDPDGAAVLLVQFALVASIFTAPFLAHIFERGLLDQAAREQRTENAKTIFELVRQWEGDVAAVEYLEAHPEATEAELHRVQVAARDGHMGPAMRSARAPGPSRDANVAHLQMALESVFGLAASAMVVAATRPTLSTFLAALSQAGKIQYLLGGFGRAKLAVELTWLGLIPFEETVRGGPGYAKELTEVLVAVGILRQGVRAHKAHLAQLGEAIARAWKSEADAHLRRLCAAAAGSEGAASAEPLPAGLVRRFEAALSWLLCREPLQREVEGLACEARRWRVGFLAHDCALRPDGRPYRARCSRRTNRPQAARPSPSTWRAGEVAVPVLMSSAGHPCMRGFTMERRSLRALMRECGVRQGLWAGEEEEDAH